MKNKILWIVLGIIIIIALWAFTGYNKLITLDESATNSWAQIDTQLQRRFDLVPNLVATVKGAAGQEQKVFGDLAAARTKYTGATNVNDQVSAANEYQGALSRLLVIVENYPQLQSIQSFRDLMVQLEGSENRIAVARKDYNDSVLKFNTAKKRFPTNILAGIFGFETKAYFDAVAGSETAPVVNFEN